MKSQFFIFFKNIYVIIMCGFLIWMSFFDSNSWFFTQRDLSNEIKKLEKQKKILIQEIEKDKILIKLLNDSVFLEKYAREKFYLKRKNEDIYLIEYDTIK